MADGCQLEKKENVHNSAAFLDIFTIFVTLVAMDCHGTYPKVTFQLRQNPRWRQAAILMKISYAMGCSIR